MIGGFKKDLTEAIGRPIEEVHATAVKPPDLAKVKGLKYLDRLGRETTLP